jgi:multiple sugar transport system ATP-binding protein
MTLGDRVAVMRAGMLQQVGSPKELYDNPLNIFVAGFIGSPAMNFFPATVEGDQLKLPFGSVPLQGRLRGAAQSASGDLVAGVRPEHFYDPTIEKVQGGTTFEVPIELVESMGSEVYAHFNVGGGTAQSEHLAELAADSGAADVPSHGEGLAVARLEPTTKAAAGQRMELGLHPETIHLFEARSGRNLVLSGSDGGAASAEIGIAPVQPAESAAPAAEQPATAPPTTEQPATERPATERPATDQPPAEGDQPSGGDTTRLS